MGYEIDFLAVGKEGQSGDAIAFRLGNLYGDRKEQFIVIIDGGFKESGEQLVNHIKKYYQTNDVDLVILTHPDADHASGLENVLTELSVKKLWMHKPWNHTRDIADMFKDGRVTDQSVRDALRRSLESARSLENLANAKKIMIEEPFTGLQAANGHITVIGPTKDYYESLLPSFKGTPEPKEQYNLMQRAISAVSEVIQKIAETFDIETLDDNGETTPENNSSAIVGVQYDGKFFLFTGDAGIPALTIAADSLNAVGIDYSKILFMQVPHHGSKRNVGPTVLNRLIGPKLQADTQIKTAYVSAAQDGAPKHPARKVTNAFRRRGAPVCATTGQSIRWQKDAPPRPDYVAIDPLPFYAEVEE